MLPPCLATDSSKTQQISSDKNKPAGYETQGSSVIECFLYPTYNKLSAFKWMGPDPLSMSTQASDMFFYMSAFAFPIEMHRIGFRLVRLDWKSGATTVEHLFFLPQVETATRNLRRVRGQLLSAISWHGFGTTGTNFRLSLWPRMKPLQYSSQSALSPLGTIPTALSLNPSFLCITYWVVTIETANQRRLDYRRAPVLPTSS